MLNRIVSTLLFKKYQQSLTDVLVILNKIQKAVNLKYVLLRDEFIDKHVLVYLHTEVKTIDEIQSIILDYIGLLINVYKDTLQKTSKPYFMSSSNRLLVHNKLKNIDNIFSQIKNQDEEIYNKIKQSEI